MFQAGPKVQRVLVGEKISDDEFQHMCRAAALHSGDGFNRRFHHWLFKIDDQQVTDMQSMHTVTVGALSGHGFMHEEHSECDGQGCKSCGWIGTVIRHLST